MRAFCLDIILFLVILFLYLGINLALNVYFIRSSPPRLSSDCLIMGDSHPMCALDPKVLNAVNVSQTAEPYIITYYKLKEFLKYNRIQKLILGFSYQNMSSYNDRELIDQQWADISFQRTYSLIPYYSIKWIAFDHIAYLKAITRNMLLFPKKRHQTYIGNFKVLERRYDPQQGSRDAIRMHFFINSTPERISKCSLSYLDSILTLCNQNRIDVLLISTPLNSSYRTHIPANFKNAFQVKADSLRVHQVEIMDYSNFPIADSLFADSDHLNFIGAKVFSDTVKVKISSLKGK